MSRDYERQMMEDFLRTVKGDNGFDRIVCPHTFDTPDMVHQCVLCDLCREILLNQALPRNHHLKDRARELSAKKRYYSNLIFLSNPSEVVVLEYGSKIFSKLIAGQVDALSEWKNFMHPEVGRNLYIYKVKVGPDRKDIDYHVEYRVNTSPLPDPSVLTRLPNIHDILALIESGRVKPVRQSRFDFQKTEVRFLPSGDPERPLFFYHTIMWHFGISRAEFDLIQRRQYNPFTSLMTSQGPEPLPSFQGAPSTGQPIQQQPSKGYSPSPPYPAQSIASTKAPVGNQPSQVTTNPQVQKIPMEAQPKKEDWFSSDDVDNIPFDTDGEEVEPICFGNFDANNPICTGPDGACQKQGWSEPCRKIYEEKLALRRKASRLNKPE